MNEFTFKLRAERSGSGFGRIYTVTSRARDAFGNTVVVSTGCRAAASASTTEPRWRRLRIE